MKCGLLLSWYSCSHWMMAAPSKVQPLHACSGHIMLKRVEVACVNQAENPDSLGKRSSSDALLCIDGNALDAFRSTYVCSHPRMYNALDKRPEGASRTRVVQTREQHSIVTTANHPLRNALSHYVPRRQSREGYVVEEGTICDVWHRESMSQYKSGIVLAHGLSSQQLVRHALLATQFE